MENKRKNRPVGEKLFIIEEIIFFVMTGMYIIMLINDFYDIKNYIAEAFVLICWIAVACFIPVFIVVFIVEITKKKNLCRERCYYLNVVFQVIAFFEVATILGQSV